MSDIAELVVIPEESVLQVFTTPNGLDPYLQKIRGVIDGFTPNVSTLAGRKEIASIAYKVAKAKTAIDGLGKDLVAELKKQPALVDAERKRMRDLLDEWKDEVRKPLTDYEAAEETRKQEREAWIDGLRRNPLAVQQTTADEIRLSVGEIESIVIDGEWLDEYETEARRVKESTLTMLRNALAERERYEAEQAELTRLRAEAAERARQDNEARIAAEASARAQREAEARAQAERDAAERRELELRLQAERAERERLAAVQREEQALRDAAAQAERTAAAERQRIADEQAAAEAETRRRERDRQHKATINNKAMEAFIAGGMPEACARQAVTLIAKKVIPGVTISY